MNECLNIFLSSCSLSPLCYISPMHFLLSNRVYICDLVRSFSLTCLSSLYVRLRLFPSRGSLNISACFIFLSCCFSLPLTCFHSTLCVMPAWSCLQKCYCLSCPFPFLFFSAVQNIHVSTALFLPFSPLSRWHVSRDMSFFVLLTCCSFFFLLAVLQPSHFW